MAVIELHNAGELNTMTASRVMRMAAQELARRGVKVIDYGALSAAIMEKLNKPTDSAAHVQVADIVAAVLGDK